MSNIVGIDFNLLVVLVVRGNYFIVFGKFICYRVDDIMILVYLVDLIIVSMKILVRGGKRIVFKMVVGEFEVFKEVIDLKLVDKVF